MAELDIKYLSFIMPIKDADEFFNINPQYLPLLTQLHKDYAVFRQSKNKKVNAYTIINNDEKYINEINEILLLEESKKDGTITQDWKIASWEIQPDKNGNKIVSIVKMISNDYTGERYAVRDGRFCLSNKTFEFEYEPSPSNRDDDFYNEFRFLSLSSAVEAYERYLLNMRNQYAKQNGMDTN